MVQELQHIVRCPECSGAIKQDLSSLSCESCRNQYPHVGGIPWLIPAPEFTLRQWRLSFNQLIAFHSQKIESFKTLGGKASVLKSERSRMEQMTQAYESNSLNLSKIFEKVFPPENKAAATAIDLGVNSDHKLESYYNNAFRDWAWDTSEKDMLFQPIEELLGSDKNLGVCALFGAGFGYSSYLLDQRFKAQIFVSMDINPFMLSVAKCILDGESIPLVEFPVAPIATKNFSVSHTLAHARPLGVSHHFLFGTALAAPLAASSLDTLLTPWLIDILPEDFSVFLRRMNGLLKKGGLWVNSGTLNFHNMPDAGNYSEEEVLELLTTNGFEIIKVDKRSLPYLQSPYSGNQRCETIFSFSVKKIKDCKQPKRFEAIPDFLRNTSLAVPKTEISDLALNTKKVQWETLSAIDGKRSTDQISQWISDRYKIDITNSKDAVLSFLKETLK